MAPLPNEKDWGDHVNQQRSPRRLKAKAVHRKGGKAWLSEDGCIMARSASPALADICITELATGNTRLVQLPQQVSAIAQLWSSPDGRAMVAWAEKPGLPELWLWKCPSPGSKSDGTTDRVPTAPTHLVDYGRFQCTLHLSIIHFTFEAVWYLCLYLPRR